MLLEKKKQKPNNEDEIILSDHDFEDEDENLEQRQEINNISSTSLNSFFIPVDTKKFIQWNEKNCTTI